VSLVQLVRFLVVELIHLNLNSIFDMCVTFTTNYFISERRRPVHSETLLGTDFINLKIKSAQSFRCIHKDKVCVRVYRGGCSYIYIYVAKRFIHSKVYPVV
jgi:hypothetical protein